MSATEWKVTCANGHSFYERVFDVHPDDVQFEACPKCGAPRTGEQLPEVPRGLRRPPPLL